MSARLLKFVAPAFEDPTLAAGLRPFLRESVNAVRGSAAAYMDAAKVGNAIPRHGLYFGRRRGAGQTSRSVAIYSPLDSSSITRVRSQRGEPRVLNNNRGCGHAGKVSHELAAAAA